MYPRLVVRPIVLLHAGVRFAHTRTSFGCASSHVEQQVTALRECTESGKLLRGEPRITHTTSAAVKVYVTSMVSVLAIVLLVPNSA